MILRRDVTNTLYFTLRHTSLRTAFPTSRQNMAYLALLCLRDGQSFKRPDHHPTDVTGMLIDGAFCQQSKNGDPQLGPPRTISNLSFRSTTPQNPSLPDSPGSQQQSLSIQPGVLGRGARSVVRLARCVVAATG